MKYPVSRLDKLLANLGYGSRREVQGLIWSGKVILDDEVIEFPEQRIYVKPDLQERMTIEGEPLDPITGMLVMVNKPVGVTCSTRKEEAPLISGLLPARWRERQPALSTVGRLDKETSGMLLLTDDGQLLHRIISPKNHVPKRYHVTLDRPLNGTEVEKLSSGTLMLESEDKPLLPVEMEALGEKEAHVTLHEGRYHQVRRMFAALGNHVVALHRNRIGTLDLPDDLKTGELRILTEEQRQKIFNAT